MSPLGECRQSDQIVSDDRRFIRTLSLVIYVDWKKAEGNEGGLADGRRKVLRAAYPRAALTITNRPNSATEPRCPVQHTAVSHSTPSSWPFFFEGDTQIGLV